MRAVFSALVLVFVLLAASFVFLPNLSHKASLSTADIGNDVRTSLSSNISEQQPIPNRQIGLELAYAQAQIEKQPESVRSLYPKNLTEFAIDNYYLASKAVNPDITREEIAASILGG